MIAKKPNSLMLQLEALENRETPNVVPVGGEFRINDATTWIADEPAVALDANGDFVVVWQALGADGSDNAILARRFSREGQALTGDILVNTHTTGSQQRPVVAADAAGNFVVVWGSASAQDGSREGVYARRFSAAGLPLTSEFRINQFTLGVQGNASLAMDSDGDFVVAWESAYQDGDGYGVYARRYSNLGTPLGNEFRVNTTTTGDQRYPSVAANGAGNFVVTWQSPDQNQDGVFAQRFTAAGVALGPEFQVNTFTVNHQARPRAAMDAAGNFTIVWESHGQDAGTTGIYARRFAASGAALTGEFRVNTYTTGDQVAPRIASNAAGDLIVSWQSPNQDGDAGGIFGQRINAANAFEGPEVRINSTTLGDQVRPGVGSDSYGNFVIAWPSFGIADDGVYAQRFYRPPLPQVTVQIDDGHPQRSSIRDLTLRFNTLVNLAPGAIQLTGPQGSVGLTFEDITALNLTTIRIHFQGPGVSFGSLANGNYQLIIHHQLVTNYLGELLDGNQDGSYGPDVFQEFHRLFGDWNGDRLVSAVDFNAFRLHYGFDSSSPNYRHYFDFDLDGIISAADFNAFRINYGAILVP
jgi:hypothetical protein